MQERVAVKKSVVDQANAMTVLNWTNAQINVVMIMDMSIRRTNENIFFVILVITKSYII